MTATTVRPPCRFCSCEVTSSNPDVDYCRECFYSGRAEADRLSGLLSEIGPAQVMHTGGGCFAIEIPLVEDPQGPFVCISSEYGGSLPETDEGPWLVCRYDDQDDFYSGAEECLVYETATRDEVVAYVQGLRKA